MLTIKGIENIRGLLIAHDDELWEAEVATEILESTKKIRYLVCYCHASKPERIDIFIYADSSILIERRIVNGNLIKKWTTDLDDLDIDSPIQFTASINRLIGVD